MAQAQVQNAPRREGSLWPALRDYWHVVAWSEDVRENGIFPATLLDEDIVVCRLKGEVVAFSDLCVHRGTPISLGSVENGRIVCCYHGWEYDAEGKCTRIPSIPDEHPIPKRACLTKYQAAERYGMVWVCMSDEPRTPIPACPLAEDPDFHIFFRNHWLWKAGAARATENFFDQAHFAFIHRGILGSPDQPLVSEARIDRDGEVLHFQVDAPATMTAADPHVRNYSVFRPFLIYHRKEMPNGEKEVFLNYSSPKSAKETMRFMNRLPELRTRSNQGDEHRRITGTHHRAGPGGRRAPKTGGAAAGPFGGVAYQVAGRHRCPVQKISARVGRRHLRPFVLSFQSRRGGLPAPLQGRHSENCPSIPLLKAFSAKP